MSIIYDRFSGYRLDLPAELSPSRGILQRLQRFARNSAIQVFLATAVCILLAVWPGAHLGIPDGGDEARWLMVAGMLPVALAMIAAHLWTSPRLARTVSYAGIAAIGLGLIALRILWLRQGVITPAYPLICFLVAAGLGCGLDYLKAVLLIAVLASLSIASSYWLLGNSPGLVLEAFSTLLLVGVVHAVGRNGQRCLHLVLVDSAQQRRLAETDPLTGLPNRRGFVRIARLALRQAQRENYPLVLALCDLDNFKAYNDAYGHVEGDRALRRIGRRIGQLARRPLDVVARMGGEEFCILWSDMAASDASAVTESLRRAIEELGVVHRDSSFGVLTLSIGAVTVNGADAQRLIRLIAEADKLMYEAKRAGRNTGSAGRFRRLKRRPEHGRPARFTVAARTCRPLLQPMTESLKSIRQASRELGVSTTQMLDWLKLMSGGVDLGQVSVETPCINPTLFDRLTDIALAEFRPDPPTRRL